MHDSKVAQELYPIKRSETWVSNDDPSVYVPVCVYMCLASFSIPCGTVCRTACRTACWTAFGTDILMDRLMDGRTDGHTDGQEMIQMSQ
jgi:hypothetical protein